MSILNEPSKHRLPDLFRELKWGRPANDQKILLALADFCERRGIGEFTFDDIASEFFEEDDSDHGEEWKKI